MKIIGLVILRLYFRSKHQTVCICRGQGGDNIEEAGGVGGGGGGGWIPEVLWTCCHHWRDEQYCYQRIFLKRQQHQSLFSGVLFESPLGDSFLPFRMRLVPIARGTRSTRTVVGAGRGADWWRLIISNSRNVNLVMVGVACNCQQLNCTSSTSA